MTRRKDEGGSRSHRTTTDGIHSNAFNFLSAVSSGVDPRTGMYSCSVSLPGVAANNLCGPTVSLGLTFSVLNPLDAGFGIGWSLTTTCYDTRRKRLSLSSGESYLVDTFVDNKATYKDRKLRSFDLIREGIDGDYRIVHKSGVSELLRVDAGSEGLAFLREVRSPEGHVVALDQTASNGIVKLRRVIDGTGRELLSVVYELGSTQVIVHPGTVQAAAFTLHVSNGRLTQLTLPAGYGDGWLFAYEARSMPSPRRRRGLWQNLLCRFGLGETIRAEVELLMLKGMTVPTGGREEVEYTWDGQSLPGAGNQPLDYMPAVAAFRRDPGHGQPVMLTRYTYSTRNFFGYGALDDWMDDEDNLYRVVMPPGQAYEYGSTETLYDGIEAVRTVERTFNRFHLLTRERTVQAGCVKEVETVYDEDPAVSFANQVPWCQLPIETRVRYYRSLDPGKFREVARTTRYDAHGNVLQATDERGATETYDYYSVEGVPGQCPPDTLGFVRFLREKRVHPPVESEVISLRATRYTYTPLPSLIVGSPSHIVPWEETLHQDMGGGIYVGLGATVQLFNDDKGVDHGRLRRVICRHNNVEGSVDYDYTAGGIEKDASGIDSPVLTIHTRKASSNGHEELQTSAAVALSCLNGLPVMDRSPNGVVMRYSHDALGRQVAETVAADSEYAATTTSTYLLQLSGSRVVKHSVTGQETIVELDGFGTAIRVLASHWNDDGLEREIWRATFDALGRKVSETTTDTGLPVALTLPPYAPDARVPTADSTVATTTTYVHDGWGNVTETHGADGVVGYHVVDPISGVAERWEEADGPAGKMRSHRSRVTQTISGKPALVETLDAEGTPCVSQRSIYDGLDRLVEETVVTPGEAECSTHYRYDAYDRLIEMIRPDGAVITTGYADHTGGALVTSIQIQHHASWGRETIPLGRQAYDGLGRRTLLQAGQRTTTYRYDAASAKPDGMTLPSGEGVSYRHDAFLGDLLAEATTADGTTVFTHHKTTGDTLSVSNALSTHTIEYDASGRVSAESLRHEGVPGEKHCSYGYSLRGTSTEYTDVGGDRHQLIFDTLGRFVRLESNDVNVDVTYDAFSRPRHTLTQSRDGSRSMDVAVSIDEHDREVERTLSARTGAKVTVQTLAQAYTGDGKLSSRRLSCDGAVREETFAYDVRDRLVAYTCTGEHAPKDQTGRRVASQAFAYDALDNVVELLTTYLDGTPSRMQRFVYADDDPTQLREIVIEQGGRKVQSLSFTYDAAGNLAHDEKGRRLLYDALGRPAGWSGDGAYRDYRYDAFGRIGSVDDGQEQRHRYYVSGQVSREEGNVASAVFHHAQGVTVAQSRNDGASNEVILVGSDSQGSVIAEAGAAITAMAYTPHGFRDAAEGASDIGYTGELKEREVDWYVLGNYRAYNPTLQRFHSPDAASPFGHGGLNAYAYCAGDPVNRSDPSGEGWVDWLFIGIGVIASGIAIAASGGTLAPAIGAVVSLSATASQATAVGLLAVDVTSLGLSIGSAAAMDAGDDALAGKLSLASMVMGLGGMGATVGPKLASGAARHMSKVFTGATKYVRPAAIRSPLALKAPRLRGGGDVTDLSRFTVSRPRLPMPSDDALRAMNGFERVNTATRDVGMRRHMISRGFISPQLLRRFPEGIDLTSRNSVISARYALSMALVDAEGLTPGMLTQTGFDADALAYLNPSLLSGQPLNLPNDELRALLRRPHGRVVEEGEHLYAMFLETGNLGYLTRYGRALLQARISNRWSRWNSPSNFVL